MNKNNSKPQGGGSNGETAVDGGGWRSQLGHGSREKMVNKIMETLKRHHQGLSEIMNAEIMNAEIMKAAVRFEGKVYSTATSQSDYLRIISLKILAMERKSQMLKNATTSSASVIDSTKRKRQDLPEDDRLAAKEAELVVAHKALKASQEQLKALITNAGIVEERHIGLVGEAIVDKWMQSETQRASMDEIMNLCYLKGFEHAYRAKASFGEAYLLKNDQFDVLEALPLVDCFSHDLPLPQCLRPSSFSGGYVAPSAR